MDDFGDINEKLAVLIAQQDDPSGCQALFMPDRVGATYLLQIAFRGRNARRAEVRQFLREGVRLLRQGGRGLCLRHYRVDAEIDHEYAVTVSRGMIRVAAADKEGPAFRLPRYEERVN